jgi:hypothetical protein
MELVILTLDRDWFLHRHKAALNGDPESVEAIASLWDDYQDTELACFVCDEPAERPVFAQVLPAENHHKLLATPLCERCPICPTMSGSAGALKSSRRCTRRAPGSAWSPDSGDLIRAANSAGSVRSSHNPIAWLNPKNSARNSHPCGHANVPAGRNISKADSVSAPAVCRIIECNGIARLLTHRARRRGALVS